MYLELTSILTFLMGSGAVGAATAAVGGDGDTAMLRNPSYWNFSCNRDSFAINLAKTRATRK